MKVLTLICISVLILAAESARSHKMTMLSAIEKKLKNKQLPGTQTDTTDTTSTTDQFDLSNPEVQTGFELGNQIMQSLDAYREKEVQMKQDIVRTDRMKQLAYELVMLIRDDIDKFNWHPEFLRRAKRVTADCYYAEFVAKVFDKAQFPQGIIDAWAKDAESKKDLQWEYDEGASYCISYSTGYLCAATLLMLPDQANPAKTALIAKLRGL